MGRSFRARGLSATSIVAVPAAVLPGLSFTAIDFETANPKRASVCSVGVVKVRNGIVVDEYSTVVLPPREHREFSRYNVAVHGITAHDVVGAPTWDQVYPTIADFSAGDALVAHNASFDRSVLTQASQAYGMLVPRSTWLCTRDASRSVLNLASYRLPDVAEALGLPPHDHHDAAADAGQCAKVLVAMCRILGPHGLDLVRQHARLY